MTTHPRTRQRRPMASAIWPSICLLTCFAACGGGDGDDGDTGSDASPGADTDPGTSGGDAQGNRACPTETKVGEFRIQLADGYTGVQGTVFDGVTPVHIREEIAADGSCRLLQNRSLFCDPPCTTETVCDEDGTCIPAPMSHSVGTVTVSGMEVELSMEPSDPANSYTNPGTLPHPGFAEDAEMKLEAAGGDYEPFDLRGWGIGPIEAPAEPIQVDKNAPAELRWTPPGTDGPAMVHAELNVSHHGGIPTSIVCVVPDTGSFDIPASLVTQLVEFGVTGWPNVVLTRRTADSVTIEPGCVQLLVVAEQTVAVELPGLLSCGNDEDCPEGQTCQIDLTCG